MTANENIVNKLAELSKSDFRRRFRLSEKDRAYAALKGAEILRSHAADFIAGRLAPAVIENDGRQTPMRNHPVFTAQHATATCCRRCLEKWHGIPPGIELTDVQQAYIVDLIMEWIRRQMM